MRPTRALIHTDNFLSNVRYVRSLIGAKPIIMAVVKANAYGHGLEIITKAAGESGEVGYFGVATEEEGVALRKLTQLPILVLTTALEDEVDEFIKNDLEFTLCDKHLLDVIALRAKVLGKKAKVHLKVDTGMRRVGVEPTDALAFAHSIAKESESIEFIGISTHFATSDEIGSAFFDHQCKLFYDVVDKVREAGIAIPIAHAANSGAILQRGKETAFDMVRPGIMLYGYAPSLELQQESRDKLKPVLEFTSAVAFTKRITKGEGVSYNLRWHAENDTNIATIPAGYGDGYPRLLTNKTNALINGKQYPVRGTICMDQILIETGNDQVRIGEEVILLSEENITLDAWTLASKIGTIPYEILTNITARVPRLVKK
ncbi:MAG TPA: alanine racemase [Candidatus Kapabacteria bacterium]